MHQGFKHTELGIKYKSTSKSFRDAWERSLRSAVDPHLPAVVKKSTAEVAADKAGGAVHHGTHTLNRNERAVAQRKPRSIVRVLRVGVLGVGYVGLTTAVCLASNGHDAVCADLELSPPEMKLGASAVDATRGSDVLAVLTEWDEFAWTDAGMDLPHMGESA